MAAAGSAALGWMYHRDRTRMIAHRRSVFEACRGLLDDAELSQDGADYPRLAGCRNGVPVELRLLADTIQLRKLPVLWLLVTIQQPVKVAGVFDMMIRPDNSEYYSPHDRLRTVLPTPVGWPDDAVVRCDRPEAVAPLLDHLTPHVCAFTGEGRGKELFVAPRGLRLAYRVDESRRGHYLATRQPLFDNDRLDRDMVESVIARGFALAADLNREN
ncbi:hypothetical protein [Aurantimonas marina]|uniref:hypothetical protein n=1 Tax=Aurantimonas marina TaxID=2780508 RepID=UPI0019D2C6DE|nr:hypothetical protein [Aurantimonas marina]